MFTGNEIPGMYGVKDRLSHECAMVLQEWDVQQWLLLEEKLSREARLMWCYSGTFSPKCLDHRNCVPHTTSAPGCGLGHLLLKEKAWALPQLNSTIKDKR